MPQRYHDRSVKSESTEENKKWILQNETGKPTHLAKIDDFAW